MMACECVICGACGGTGNVWFSFPGADRGGQYLGNHRCDDLDTLEPCEECHGGLTEICYECQDSEEDL